jgi:creatinine amidohydrolase/Fe(II)-dependent formamide hydrolase-like protein
MNSKPSFEAVAFLLLVLALWLPKGVMGQVYDLAAMNSEDLGALDRARTVVLIAGGILEQHGPYLPAYTDGYLNERLARDVAEAIVARPGWVVLLFPTIPLGTGGANEIGRKYVFPGTYAVRSETLRSVFMDLAGELGEQGFRWIFVMHGHGAPNHNRMLDDAGDFFHDTYGGWMVHLRGLAPVNADVGTVLDPATREADGFAVHAGAVETSAMLYLRPQSVSPGVRSARDHTGHDWDELVSIAREPDWPGYFGAPRMASPAQGARIFEAVADAAIHSALQILDGLDPRSIPRIGTLAQENPVNVAIDTDALQRELAIARKQEEWLARRMPR